MVKDGDLTEKQRNTLLAEMTDEVAALVLRDNYEQNLALANAIAHAPSLLHVHEDFMRRLERDGVLNREVEGLPSPRQVRRLLERGDGLSAPELSVLMAWTKIVLAAGAARRRPARRPVPRARPARLLPHRRSARASRRRSRRTRCAARSS